MSEVDLQSLQASFGRLMLADDDAENSGTLVGLVRPAGKLSPAQSLGVYRRNVRGSLIRALRDIYPVSEQLLGEKRFCGIAAGYVRLHPSEDSDLNKYGQRFAGFLQLYCDEHTDRRGRFGYLPGLAQLEWSYHCAYYAEDDLPFDFESFSRVAESDRGCVVFGASCALTLISSAYPLCEIWRTRTGPAPSGLPVGQASSEYLCVYRDGLRPALARLPSETYRLLEKVAKGSTLDTLSGEFYNLDRRLPLLIEKGWVVSFRLEPEFVADGMPSLQESTRPNGCPDA